MTSSQTFITYIRDLIAKDDLKFTAIEWAQNISITEGSDSQKKPEFMKFSKNIYL